MRNSKFSTFLNGFNRLFSAGNGNDSHESEAQMAALDKSLAVIEFKVDGTIITANSNFLKVMGYQLSEVKGKHHSIFVDPDHAKSAEYRQFWDSLKQGKFQQAEFRRLGKYGKEVWIQATYNPISDDTGNIIKVVKFATDITVQKTMNTDYLGQIEAINKSQAVIEFDMDGNILSANENFLDVMGYKIEEVKGKHHSMFVDPVFAKSSDYKTFWKMLNDGQYQAAEYLRLGKNGRKVWIRAIYNPILDLSGKPVKVVKFASDITEEKARTADFSGQISAIGKALAVIEFQLDGTIISANENFLDAMGYSLQEIKGKHHSMFVEPEVVDSPEYKEFWKTLGNGEYLAGEFKRIGKRGRNVWIQASYNPIFDATGKPMKVVKYATDITEQKLISADYAGQIEAIGKSQAVIEFSLDGTIVSANSNFLSAMGYTLEEIKGKHHSIFVDASFAASGEYRAFWEKLRRGEFEAAEFKRIGKGGKEVWIQASYNPICDLNGNPVKVVKYATDVTSKKKAVSQISEALLLLSKGDLRYSITEPLDDEFEPVRDAFNSTLHRLNELVTDISRAASSVTTASGQIRTGTGDLSNRTESQSASLEQTAASMQEMMATTSQSADNAKLADEVSQSATKKAELGGDVVLQAVGAMAEIEVSSRQISDIIGVINEIAFQTNLLALNAAVEAARAGDQGRGFAVVAGEVRNLAQRSAKASVEIKELINESVAKVKDGTHLVRESGETLVDIVAAIKDVSGLISTINIATQEQNQGISEINKAVTSMDEMTQQNAGLAEETTAASESLTAEAENLLALVRFFKTEAG